jgi:DNA ligase-4
MDYTTDLREVTKSLSDPNAVGHPSLTLMQAFTPMCSRQLMRENNLKEWFPGIFWAEEKFDGERIQIHKDGDIVKMFSRNAVDYTNLFGSVTRMITDNNALNATRCILDGEILAWDNFHGCFGRCSAVKTAAVATGGVIPHSNVQNTPQSGGQWAIAVRLFDVLQVENKCVMDRPLCERRATLNSIVNEIPDLLQVVKPLSVLQDSVMHGSYTTHELTTYAQAIEVMCSVVDNGSEGVVLKDPASTYKVGTRVNSRWVKLKPDYFENGGIGGNNDLDLLIIGAACGRGGGRLTHYLVALAADPSLEIEKPETFVSFSHISKSISSGQARELEQIFEGHKIRVDFNLKRRICRYNTPDVTFEWRNGEEYERKRVLVTWLKTDELPGVEVIYSGLKTEDVHWVFDPRRSVLVAVNADPIPMKTTKFATEYTLRFPRLHSKGVRNPDEKAWYQCLQESEWNSLMANSQHKPGTASPTGAVPLDRNKGLGHLNKHVKDMKRKSEAPPSQLHTVHGRHDRQGDKKRHEMLHGWIVYVHRNCFEVRNVLMRKATELGAKTFEMNPQTGKAEYDRTKFAGISTNTSSSEFNSCKSKNLDVVDSKWLLDCWTKADTDPHASVIELCPEYMLNTAEP